MRQLATAKLGYYYTVEGGYYGGWYRRSYLSLSTGKYIGRLGGKAIAVRYDRKHPANSWVSKFDVDTLMKNSDAELR